MDRTDTSGPAAAHPRLMVHIGLIGVMALLAVFGICAGPVAGGEVRAPVAVAKPVVAPPRPTRLIAGQALAVRVPSRATPSPAVAAVAHPRTSGIKPVSGAAPVAGPCATALAYLAAHAAPGFAHFCRPGSLQTAQGPVASYTCVPGRAFTCPDGVAEIIIADPTCAASYENEASNSYWDFTDATGAITAGTTQHGRSWDPYGTCPSSPAG